MEQSDYEDNTSTVYQRYKIWCTENGHYSESIKTFRQRLETVKTVVHKRSSIGGERTDTHYGTKQKLDEMGIPYTRRKARQVTLDDYHNFDYLIIMDENNGRNLKRIVGDDVDSKVDKAMSFVGESRDVKDPWYTGNFDETYDDLSRSCDALLELIKEKI